MLGAIAGDLIGSVYEWHPTKSIDFPLFSTSMRFTDDTVLTVATAQAILLNAQYSDVYKSFGRRYPYAGYGGGFKRWLYEESAAPYNSFGNGSAMRISPVGFAYETMDEILIQAERSAAATHNHPEGIKGAQAVALAIFLSRKKATKIEIRHELETRFNYDLQRSLDSIRPSYQFDVTCQGSVPEAIIAFLESTDFDSAIRLAISLGGDADTQACIAGGIAQAFYGQISTDIVDLVHSILPQELNQIVNNFNQQFHLSA